MLYEFRAGAARLIHRAWLPIVAAGTVTWMVAALVQVLLGVVGGGGATQPLVLAPLLLAVAFTGSVAVAGRLLRSPADRRNASKALWAVASGLVSATLSAGALDVTPVEQVSAVAGASVLFIGAAVATTRDADAAAARTMTAVVAIEAALLLVLALPLDKVDAAAAGIITGWMISIRSWWRRAALPGTEPSIAGTRR